MKKQTVGWVFWIVTVSLFVASGSYAFEFHGFADVSFTKCTNDACESILGEGGGRNGNFAFGELDLYVAEERDNVDILIELVVEVGEVIDLERVTLGYTFSDALRLRIGRFHTPLGFWNAAFHHGTQIQPTINRPEFLHFEHDHGTLPLHTIGAYLSGRVRTAVLVLEYGVTFGNGGEISAKDGEPLILPNNVSDNNVGKAVTFSATISPTMIEGLKVVISGHTMRVQSDSDGNIALTNLGRPIVDVDQNILNVSLIYTLNNLELMSEYFSIKDKDNLGSAGSNTSSAYYGLLSYTVANRWIPYFLYENMSIKEEDPYFIALGSSDVEKTVGGLRYNINYWSSVKAELRNVDWGNNDWNEYGVQWSSLF